MPHSKMNTVLTTQSEREFAYSGRIAQRCCSARTSFARFSCVAGHSSISSASFCSYRYPPLDRPAYSPSRPITEFRLQLSKTTADIGYHGEIVIHRLAGCANCGAADIKTIGLSLCKRHQSSLRQWQYLVWRVALKATQSGALRAQVQVSWPQTFWARTAQGQCSRGLPLAYFATTQVSTAAVKIDNRARHGRVINKNRSRGHAPAAVLRFGDER